MRTIYIATSVEAGRCFGKFEAKRGNIHPPIIKSWRNNWARIMPLFDYPPEIRRVIYTTNVTESVNMSLRKVTKNQGSLSNDEAFLV
ncbi:MAG: transposase mutator type [Gallionellaceae bacterium]|nr:MAG: transposase mutator type [Gallionellaceae bacterium]